MFEFKTRLTYQIVRAQSKNLCKLWFTVLVETLGYVVFSLRNLDVVDRDVRTNATHYVIERWLGHGEDSVANCKGAVKLCALRY